MLPLILIPFSYPLAEAINPEFSYYSSLRVILLSVISASIQAHLFSPKDEFYSKSLATIGFVIFSVIIFYNTLLHIERGICL